MASRRRFPVSVYDQINVTSLIDTLFFLLIIFMLTAPLLEYSVDVSPPQMNATKIEPDDHSKSINVRKDGTILFDHREVSMEQLQMELHALKQEQISSKIAIYLRADRELSYGGVIDVMRQIRMAGFEDIQLVTEEEPKS